MKYVINLLFILSYLSLNCKVVDLVGKPDLNLNEGINTCENLFSTCSGFVRNVTTSDTIPRELRDIYRISSDPIAGSDYSKLSMVERDSIFPDSCIVGQPYRIIFENILCDTQYLSSFDKISKFFDSRDTFWRLWTEMGSDSDGMTFSIRDGKIISVLRKSVGSTGQY